MTYSISSICAWQELSDYIYIKNLETGKLYFLKELAATIWKQLVSGKEIDEIIKNLSSPENNLNNVHHMITCFVGNLCEIGVLQDGDNFTEYD